MRKLKSFALGFVGVVSALTITLYAGAAVTGDRLKIPVSIGQAQAVLEKIIFDIGSGSSNPTVQSTSTGQVQVTTNGSVAMTVDTNQKVGIGTASPALALDVKPASGSAIRLEDSTGAVTFDLASGSVSTVNNDELILTPGQAGNGLVVRTTNLSNTVNNTLTVARTARVGVNQTTPVGTLQVDLPGADTDFLRFNNSGAGFHVDFSYSTTAVTGDAYDLLINTSGNGSGYDFQTVTSGGVVKDALTLNKNGQVGVNNTNPADTLDVGGGVKATYANLTGTGGNTPHGCAIRISNFTGGGARQCNAGEIATGGGCHAITGSGVLDSYPSAADTWTCNLVSGTGTVYAICCSI